MLGGIGKGNWVLGFITDPIRKEWMPGGERVAGNKYRICKQQYLQMVFIYK